MIRVKVLPTNGRDTALGDVMCENVKGIVASYPKA